MKIIKFIKNKIIEISEQIPNLLKKYGFTIVFYTFGILSLWLVTQTYLLTNFKGRIISMATADMFDISTRINTVLIAFLMLVLIGMTIITLFYLAEKYLHQESTSKILQASSFIGILFLCFNLLILKLNIIPFIFIILLIHFLCIVNDTLSRKWKILEYQCSPIYFSWLFIISFSVTAFIFDNNSLSHLFNFSSFNEVIGVFLTCMVLFFSISSIVGIIKQKSYQNKNSQQFLSSLLFISFPIILLGFLPFLSKELCMILNQHSSLIITPTLISVIGFILFLLTSIILFWINSFWCPSAKKILTYFYFPMFILILGTLLWYYPGPIEITDMFEPANSGLMIQQFFEFGKIPILETFNAHFFSDAFWGFINSFINGYNIGGIVRYDFFQHIFELIIIYFFVQKITKNQYIALGLILFFPNINIIFPFYFVMSLIVLGSLIYTLKSQKIYLYILLFLVFISILLWKIDVGLSSILAVIASIILLYIAKYPYSINWKKLIISFSYVGATVLIAFLILCKIKGINILDWLKDFFVIIQSNQAHGYTGLGKIDKYFIWSYFVAPSILIITICGMIIYGRLKKLPFRKSIIISFLFLTTYTLINLALRGVVRHSLVENFSDYVLSFSTLLIGGLTVFILRKYSIYIKITAFIFIVSIISYQFVLPIQDFTNEPGIVTKAFLSLDKLPAININNLKVKNTSESQSDYSKKEYSDFVNFINTQLNKNETFFDFSTSPMLYVYTHKETPFYTNHLMLMYNDYLQDRVLQKIKNYNIPILVFSYANGPYNLDGIPFQLRYYKLTEYFYQNYHPYTILNNREIWIKNDWNPQNNTNEIIILNKERLLSSNLNHSVITDTTKNFFNAIGSDPFIYNLIPKNKVPILKLNKFYYLKIAGNSKLGGIMQLFYNINNCGFIEDKSTSIQASIGDNLFYIPISFQNNNAILNDLRLDFADNDKFTIESIQFIESTKPIYIPLKHSSLTQNFETKFIPYMWGTFDPIDVDKLQLIRSIDITTQNKNITATTPSNTIYKFEFSFLSEEEKQQGAYIVLHLKSLPQKNETEKKDPQQLLLQYGDNQETRGSINFNIVPDGKSHRYAIRVSTQYSWIDYKNNWITLQSAQKIPFELEQISIVQADK